MQKNGPDILVFPPLLSVVVPALAVALEIFVPISNLLKGGGLQIGAGLVLGIAAFALAFSGTRAFKAAQTNVDPRQEALFLVETGPYKFTRNPMYLGMVLLQLAIGLLFSVEWAFVGGLVVLTSLHFGVVLREEAYLTEKFGAPYSAFMARTRRWL